MTDKLSQTKAEALQAIECAKGILQQASTCVTVYQMIKNTVQPQQAELFEWFLETANLKWTSSLPGETPSDPAIDLLKLLDDDGGAEAVDLIQMLENGNGADSNYELLNNSFPVQVTPSDISTCRAKFGRMVTGIIDLYSNEGYSAEKYYATLWQVLDTMLSPYTDIEKGICLYIVTGDKRTPYWAMQPGLRMSDEDYQKVITTIVPAIRKMWFVLGLSNGQRTQTASQLLSVLEELETFEERTVLLSQLIGAIEKDD